MLPVKCCFWLPDVRLADLEPQFNIFWGGGGSYLHDCCRESEAYCNTYGGWQGSE